MATRPLDPRDRLIFALDVPTKEEARRLVDELEGTVSFFKVGYQLFVAEGMTFVRELIGRGHRVFLDLKMDDVGETISLAVREIAKNNVDFLTIHGGAATAKAAVAGRGDSALPKILSVTLLTSMNQQDLVDLGLLGDKGRFATIEAYVRWRAEQALQAKCDGLIAAGTSVADLRAHVGPEPIIVTPGIRPAGVSTDDHKRPTTPREAIAAGADYLVVGRPIRDAADRRDVARRIIDDIEQGLAAAASRPGAPHSSAL